MSHFSLTGARFKAGTPVHTLVEYDKDNDHVEMRSFFGCVKKSASNTANFVMVVRLGWMERNLGARRGPV